MHSIFFKNISRKELSLIPITLALIGGASLSIYPISMYELLDNSPVTPVGLELEEVGDILDEKHPWQQEQRSQENTKLISRTAGTAISTEEVLRHIDEIPEAEGPEIFTIVPPPPDHILLANSANEKFDSSLEEQMYIKQISIDDARKILLQNRDSSKDLQDFILSLDSDSRIHWSEKNELFKNIRYVIVATQDGTYLYYQYADSIKRNNAKATSWFSALQAKDHAKTSNIYIATAINTPVASDIELMNLYDKGDAVIVFANDFEEIGENACLGKLSDGVLHILTDPSGTIAFTCTNTDVDLEFHVNPILVHANITLPKFDESKYCADKPESTTFDKNNPGEYPLLAKYLHGWTTHTCIPKNIE